MQVELQNPVPAPEKLIYSSVMVHQERKQSEE